MIRFAEIAVGRGGGVRCSRCHDDAGATTYRGADEVIAEISAACGLWESPPGPNVMLAGAEPFGHPALPTLIGAALEAQCRRIGLETDAVALASPQNAVGSLMAGVRHLRWRLLAGTPGIHDALLSQPGALDASVEGVRSFKAIASEQGIDVSVTAVVPVCRHNVHDLPGAVLVAVRAGAGSVRLSVEDGGLDLAAALPWIVAACDTGVVNGVWVEAEGVPFCLLPGYDLHVADAVRHRSGAKQPACASCALDRLCGGAPSSASADQRSLLAPPPFASTLALAVARSRGGEVR